MNRPPTKTMVTGHPIVAVPVTLASGVCLLAGFQTSNAFAVMTGMVLIAGVTGAARQAQAYRAWKAEWDEMAGDPASTSTRPSRVVAMVLVAGLMLIICARPQVIAYWAGYALGWLGSLRWPMAGLGFAVAAMLVQRFRHGSRRAKASMPISIIAKRALPVPTLADAYRALPPYCRALLQARQ